MCKKCKICDVKLGRGSLINVTMCECVGVYTSKSKGLCEPADVLLQVSRRCSRGEVIVTCSTCCMRRRYSVTHGTQITRFLTHALIIHSHCSRNTLHVNVGLTLNILEVELNHDTTFITNPTRKDVQTKKLNTFSSNCNLIGNCLSRVVVARARLSLTEIDLCVRFVINGDDVIMSPLFNMA